MTPEQLKAIKERADKATAGPWLGDCFDGTTKYQVVGGLGDATECVCVGDDNNTCTHTVLKVQHKSGEFGFVGPNGDADENFVRHARTDVPALVAEVERLWTENDRLRQDRYDALTVKTREGWLASEWIARTGKAERERDAACKEVERLRRIEAAAKAYRDSYFAIWDERKRDPSANPYRLLSDILLAEGKLLAALDAAESGE